MKHLVSEKSEKFHTMPSTKSLDVTFHGTYDKVVENFSHILAVKSREKITVAKNNPLCNALPQLSAAFCLLSLFPSHCSDWQGKYRSLRSGTWTQLHRLLLVMTSLLHNSEKSKCTFPGKLKGITFNRRVTNAKGKKESFTFTSLCKKNYGINSCLWQNMLRSD